jgi:hypothetical protein
MEIFGWFKRKGGERPPCAPAKLAFAEYFAELIVI